MDSSYSALYEYLPVALASAGLLVAGYLIVLRRHTSTSKLPAGPFNPLGRLYGRSGKESTAKVLGLKKYGDVCCIRVLGTPCIFLNTHAKIREYFVSHADAMSGRLDMRSIKHRFAAGRGIVMNDGASWTAHRRFVMSTLRDFGFGRGGTEQIIQNELQHLIDVCASHKTQAFDTRLVFNIATCNVISSLVFGERCGNDSRFAAILDVVRNIFNSSNDTHTLLGLFLFRTFSKLPNFLTAKAFSDFDKLMDYMEEKVEEHRKRYNGEVNDIVDGYLKVLFDERTKQEISGSEDFSLTELYATISDLYIAGMETTASTLCWAMLFLIRSPDVQKRARMEIQQVLQGRLPTMADRKDLPYTDAVVCEVQRFATLTPLGGIEHVCTEAVRIGQYEIPKDSLVTANLLAVHRDESVWPDALHFNPLNFYDESQNSLKNTEYLTAFSVGRRSCLGESLAKQELFIFITGLIQKFEITCPDLSLCPDPDEVNFGSLRFAPPFESVFTLI